VSSGCFLLSESETVLYVCQFNLKVKVHLKIGNQIFVLQDLTLD
jgi:hypothetical protein